MAKEERCYDQHAAFAEWLSHWVDALELVDWRSGEIRDLAINQWLLEETLAAMSHIDQPRVKMGQNPAPSPKATADQSRLVGRFAETLPSTTGPNS